jgi:hypothetical protein
VVRLTAESRRVMKLLYVASVSLLTSSLSVKVVGGALHMRHICAAGGMNFELARFFFPKVEIKNKGCLR